MIRYSLDEIKRDPKSVVTVGTFDGLHVAHRKILSTLVEKSKMIGGRSVAITFRPHPQEILGKRKVEMLMTEDARVAEMDGAGIDEVCLLKFDREFSLVSAEDFLLKLVREKVGLHELVLGYNHTFGRGAEGTVEFARRIGEREGFKVDYIEAVMIDGRPVSTSIVRGLLKNGDLETANRMLGRPYSVVGDVVKGDARGRTLGYPTANLKPMDGRLLYPAFGVYIVEVELDGVRYDGLASVGVRPTFEDGNKVVMEAWMSDFDRDIYGKRLKVSFVRRLREERKFDSRDELILQMDADRKMLFEYQKRTQRKQKQEF